MTLEQKLLSHREIKSMGYITPCWLWTAGKASNGYGRIWDYDVNLDVHVLAAKLWLKGYIPKLWVLHKCDIRACFNPDHLFQGTQYDNMRDMTAKGKHRNKRKTHCKRGHEFTFENTGWNGNARYCLTCKKDYNRLYVHKIRI